MTLFTSKLLHKCKDGIETVHHKHLNSANPRN
jgi:hypothetical protein